MTREEIVKEISKEIEKMSFRELKGLYIQTGDKVWQFFVNKPKEGNDGWILKRV